MERFGSTSHRGYSVRSILTSALVVLIAALLWVIIGGQTTHALGDTDASWSGDVIIYDGHAFNKTTDFKDTTNTIPAGATVYQAPLQAGATSDSKKALIIYFSAGVDPPAATTAKYVEFDYSSNQQTSNPQNQKDIKLTVKGKETQLQSCSVDGIGWIICPISTFLAGGMDFVFHLLAGMISVQPSVLGDPNNSMYIAWNVMRNIANIAFVIVFLIIIYSQLTNYGVSNYGLKKLIPRLIIAAILVNVSFIIAAAAIDVSNVLGYSIQSMLNEIAKSVFHITNDSFSGVNSWTAITTVVLAGGGYIGATYFIASGGVYLLLPILLGVLLTIIFVVIILAARQAIIVILVIIAPIAFVANLLPNTEKWFDKWKDLFFTMLIFFPAFSLVFGGSQLAGQLIIQNAGDNIVMVIFGLAVQIAPLVITPLLLKFSGSLLGKIAQIANNPRKGIMDRSKNWANTRREMQKQNTLQKNRSWWNTGGKLMQVSDNSARKTKDRTELYKLRADNKYHESPTHEKIHEQMQAAEFDKQRIDNQHTAHIQGKVNIRGSELNIKALELEDAKISAEAATDTTSAMMSEYRAGSYNTGNNERLARLQTSMADNVMRSAAQKQRAQAANYIQQENFANAINENRKLGTDVEGLLTIARGVGGLNAEIRAQSTASATIQKMRQEALDNNKTLIRLEAQKTGERGVDRSRAIITAAMKGETFNGKSIIAEQLEAAYEMQADDGQTLIFEDGRGSDKIDQNMLDRVIERNSGTMKAKGGFHLQADTSLSYQRYLEKFREGKLTYYDAAAHEEKLVTDESQVKGIFDQAMQRGRVETLSNTNSDGLGGVKFGTFVNTAANLEQFLNVMDVTGGDDNKVANTDRDTLNRIRDALRIALEDPNITATMTDRKKQAREMEAIISKKLGKEPLKEPEEGSDETPGDPTDGTPSDADDEA